MEEVVEKEIALTQSKLGKLIVGTLSVSVVLLGGVNWINRIDNKGTLNERDIASLRSERTMLVSNRDRQLAEMERASVVRDQQLQNQTDELKRSKEGTDKAISELYRKIDAAVIILDRIDKQIGVLNRQDKQISRANELDG